MMFSIANAF